jgi:hypothetical protein
VPKINQKVDNEVRLCIELEQREMAEYKLQSIQRLKMMLTAMSKLRAKEIVTRVPDMLI